MFDIAIVEDEELERKALRKILEQQHDNVRIVGEARNGTEAVELIDTTHIDLMLVDIRIPRPNGLEIIQMVRDRGLATKVIILTAYDHFDIMKEAIHLKADNFLLKPIRTEELLKAVTECLGEVVPVETPSGSSTLSESVSEFANNNNYRDCLSFVRGQLKQVYSQEGAPLRRGLREFLDALSLCHRQQGLELPPEMVRDTDSLLAQNLDIRSHFQVQELAFQMIDLLFEVKGHGAARGSDHVQDVLNFIERNLHNRVSLEDAADFARISPSYLSRLFHKEINTTFVGYIKDLRIARAKELLAGSSLPIGNVALDLSFSDTNYFCRVFRKEVGLSPSEFRRNHQKPH